MSFSFQTLLEMFYFFVFPYLSRCHWSRVLIPTFCIFLRLLILHPVCKGLSRDSSVQTEEVLDL